MAPTVSLVLSMFLMCMLETGCCQTAGQTDITITPQTLTLMPNESDSTGGQVTINCRASSLGTGESLIAINILRVRHSNPNAEPVEVVGAAIGSEDAVLKDQSLQGATVSGGINTKSITLTMTRAKCNDGGMYICEATSLAGNQVKNYAASKNVTIQVSPGSITLIADPSGITSWKVNDTLTIRCNGVVGTVDNPDNVEWMWEYQNVNPDFPGAIQNWQSYSLIGDPSDISTDPLLSQSPGQCYRRQISTLTRHLTLDDTNRQYRCYVNNRDVSGQIPSQDYAQVLEVGTVAERVTPPHPDTVTPSHPDTTAESTGTDVEPQTTVSGSTGTEAGPQSTVSESTGTEAAHQSTVSVQTSQTPSTSTSQTDDSGTNKQQVSKCPDVYVITGAVIAALVLNHVHVLADVIDVFWRRMQKSSP